MRNGNDILPMIVRRYVFDLVKIRNEITVGIAVNNPCVFMYP